MVSTMARHNQRQGQSLIVCLVGLVVFLVMKIVRWTR
jgi:hypothetical protein